MSHACQRFWNCCKTLTFCSLLAGCRILAPATQNHILTSKSAPNMFVHFDLEMCVAPQPRTLLNISTSKSALTVVCFVHFDFQMCFAPQRRAMFRHLHNLTSKCASRHNGVQFFISHLHRWLRTRRFSEPTFRPSGATNHWKNTVFRDFSTFSRTCIFFLLLFSSLTLPTSAYSSVHIVGSLTSKLPSIRHID